MCSSATHNFLMGTSILIWLVRWMYLSRDVKFVEEDFMLNYWLSKGDNEICFVKSSPRPILIIECNQTDLINSIPNAIKCSSKRSVEILKSTLPTIYIHNDGQSSSTFHSSSNSLLSETIFDLGLLEGALGPLDDMFFDPSLIYALFALNSPPSKIDDDESLCYDAPISMATKGWRRYSNPTLGMHWWSQHETFQFPNWHVRHFNFLTERRLWKKNSTHFKTIVHGFLFPGPCPTISSTQNGFLRLSTMKTDQLNVIKHIWSWIEWGN